MRRMRMFEEKTMPEKAKMQPNTDYKSVRLLTPLWKRIKKLTAKSGRSISEELEYQLNKAK